MNGEEPESHWLRDSLILTAVAVAAMALIFAYLPAPDRTSEVGFGELIQDAKEGQVRELEVRGTTITATYWAPEDATATEKRAVVPDTVDLPNFLVSEGISISGGEQGQPAVQLVFKNEGGSIVGNLGTLFLTLLPVILIAGFFIWILRQSRMPGSQAMDFGKSHARMVTGHKIAVTFDDVAGVDEAKEELSEVVDFLKHPEKFAALGARIPKGILLLGPPGTGKTLLARAVAGEAKVPFFSMSGSEFVEMFVGVGASRVRDLFTQAKANAPCIIFLDEIDAVGRQRGTGLGGGHDEREQTLNQILVEMDGFEPGTNIVVIAATNRPDILDPALIRPGRFDRKVVLDAPDVRGREAILKVHTRGKPLEDGVVIENIAKATPGFTGADIANLVNEAAMLAARRNKASIGMPELEEAIERVIAGPERRSRIMSYEERRLMAYHEGGHAVVAHLMEHHDRPQKVTIVSRGAAAGYTRFLPGEEVHFQTPQMFRDQICAALGGHAAEQLVFGQASTGPSNDLEQVSRVARAMVTRWGMSPRLGPITFGKTQEFVFLGGEISEPRNYSEQTAQEIDEEVRQIVESEQARAYETLREHRPLLDKLAAKLLEVETLQGNDLAALLASDPPKHPPPDTAGIEEKLVSPATAESD
ncbi:MAG TPA: ATP-dependent zinc metalloprotease FtsH [Tepidiformaceae bacterium]|nr:ATP-dependent zinc metalloprotease FtsH [Tepidiformaceae bacterium]